MVASARLDLDGFLDSVLGEALAAVGTDQGSVMLRNERDNVLEIVCRRGPPYDRKKKHRRFKVGEGVAGHVAQSCQPYVTGSVSDDPLFMPPIGGWNFASLVVVPILRGGSAIGVICADSPKASQFNPAHVEMLERLTREIGDVIQQLAVETSIRYRKRLTQLDSLHEVAVSLTQQTFESPQDLRGILKQIAMDAERVLEADLVTLYEYHRASGLFDTPPTISGQFRSPEYMVAAVNPDDAPARIVDEGSSQYREHAATDPLMRARAIVPAGDGLPARPSFVDREQVQSSAGILLKAAEEAVGVMFINYREPHSFSEDERHVIEIFAAYAALAIRGSRQFVGRRLEALQLSSRMVTHRLRNILPIVSDGLDTLLQADTSAQDKESLARVSLTETRRAQRTVKEFEAFAKAEGFPRTDVLAPAQLLTGLEKVVKASLVQTDGSVKSVIGSQEPVVQVNLDRLKDDFLAFALDSERHRPSGLSVTLSAELAARTEIDREGLPPGKKYLRLSYIDNGPGIPSKLKERIFEPFFTTTGGSGLGLAIAAHNARVNGGRIVERGAPGQGVHFDIYLPEKSSEGR